MSDEAQNGNGTDFTALLAYLDETPNQLANFTASLNSDELRFQTSPDEFSILENICHLRDLELQGYTPRIRRILAEADPTLADFDGARVAAESSYNSELPGFALQTFQTARRENVEMLRTLTERQLNREGTLAGVGTITLRRLAEMMREHDEGHLEDLRVLSQRLRQARKE
ncbi:MAG TPA: DinB family protein [Pyrinomonadaceae bacterium]|nr:DinB family protein [Pyrinomonadaceae bacterium]